MYNNATANTRWIIIYFLAYCLFVIIGTLLDERILLITLSAAKYTIYALLFIAGIVLFRQTIVDSWELMKSHVFRNLLLLFGFYLVYVLLSGLIYALIGPHIGTSGLNDQKIYQVMTALPPYVTLPVLGVIGPIVEEFIFRHILINRLSKQFGTWLCVFISSLLFGLLHIHSLADLFNIVPYVITGLVLGTLYVKSKYNLLLPILFHVFTNLSGLIPMVMR